MDCMIADVGTVFMSAAGWIITYGQNMLCPSPCTKGRTRISPVAIWNINAGTHIHNRNKEVLIWETKFRRCINIWHRGCSVCERVQWRRVSVPPSLKLWWANLGCVRAVEVLGSRTGDCSRGGVPYGWLRSKDTELEVGSEKEEIAAVVWLR